MGIDTHACFGYFVETFRESSHAPMQPLLEVRHLSVVRLNQPQANPIVSDVSFSLDRGKCLIILGESGGGKTVLTRALTMLFPPRHPFGVTGDVVFEGRRLSERSEEEMSLLRRRSIRYVFQEPARALNPLATIALQMALADGRSEQGNHGFEKDLADVGIADPAGVLRSFPHQLSIGMAQRVMIAMALLPNPALVIADEPTSAVDVDTREMILQVLLRRQREGDMAMIVATHDIEVAPVLGHRVIVMLGGMIVEAGPVEQVLSSPHHPYVQEFLATSPTRAGSQPIDDMPPPLESPDHPWTIGACCVYAGRCPKAKEMCRTDEPQLESTDADREVRCFFWK